MGSPSAMGELLPFRQDGDNGSSRGQCLTAARPWKRTGGPLCEPVAGRACSGVILISISKEPLRLLLAMPADDSTVAFMRLKRAVDAVDETLPDRGRVEQILPNVAERKRRLKEQVPIRDVDGQIASECPRVHRPLVQINGDLFPVYVDRVALVTRKAPRPAFQIDRVGMCSRCSEQRGDDDGCFQLHSYLVAL